MRLGLHFSSGPAPCRPFQFVGNPSQGLYVFLCGRKQAMHVCMDVCCGTLHSVGCAMSVTQNRKLGWNFGRPRRAVASTDPTTDVAGNNAAGNTAAASQRPAAVRHRTESSFRMWDFLLQCVRMCLCVCDKLAPTGYQPPQTAPQLGSIHIGGPSLGAFGTLARCLPRPARVLLF